MTPLGALLGMWFVAHGAIYLGLVGGLVLHERLEPAPRPPVVELPRAEVVR